MVAGSSNNTADAIMALTRHDSLFGVTAGGSIGTHQAQRALLQVPCHLVGGAARAPGHRRYVIELGLYPRGRRVCPTLTRTLIPSPASTSTSRRGRV